MEDPVLAGAGFGGVLVTGATGFIGRRLCERLRGQSGRVVELRRPPAGGAADGADVRPVVFADVAADSPIELPAGIDTVFHLAGKAHALAEVAQDEAEYRRINRDGTRRLLESAQRAGVRTFVFFSSVKAVGPAPGSETPAPRLRGSSPVDESVDTPPDTPYGLSKREAENLVLHGGYVKHAVVLRPVLVYGPGVSGNLEKMIEAVRRGRFPPLPETGNKRSMVHVDDLITAAITVARDPRAAGRTYIVADNAPCSTREMFEWVCGALGKPVPRFHMPLVFLRLLGLAGDVIGRLRGRRFVFDSAALEKLTGDAWYSSQRLQRELAWTPVHTFRASIGAIVRAGPL